MQKGTLREIIKKNNITNVVFVEAEEKYPLTLLDLVTKEGQVATGDIIVEKKRAIEHNWYSNQNKDIPKKTLYIYIRPIR